MLNNSCIVYEIEPLVWGRVGQNPWVQPRVDPARGLAALGLGRPGAAPKGLVQPCPKPRALFHKQYRSYLAFRTTRGTSVFENELAFLWKEKVSLWAFRTCAVWQVAVDWGPLSTSGKPRGLIQVKIPEEAYLITNVCRVLLVLQLNYGHWLEGPCQFSFN